MKKLILKIGSVLALIFLGAIGSGLWDLFFFPLLNRISDFSLSLIVSLFHSYVDIIYKDVSRNPSDNFALVTYMFFIVTAILGPLFILPLSLYRLRYLRRKIKALDEEDTDKSTPEALLVRIDRVRSFLKLLVPLILFVSISYALQFFQTIHSVNASLFIERSIEIVSPNIDDGECLELRAEFRAIEKAKDFYHIEDRLRKIAMQHSIKLPKFESIR